MLCCNSEFRSPVRLRAAVTRSTSIQDPGELPSLAVTATPRGPARSCGEAGMPEPNGACRSPRLRTRRRGVEGGGEPPQTESFGAAPTVGMPRTEAPPVCRPHPPRLPNEAPREPGLVAGPLMEHLRGLRGQPGNPRGRAPIGVAPQPPRMPRRGTPGVEVVGTSAGEQSPFGSAGSGWGSHRPKRPMVSRQHPRLPDRRHGSRGSFHNRPQAKIPRELRAQSGKGLAEPPRSRGERHICQHTEALRGRRAQAGTQQTPCSAVSCEVARSQTTHHGSRGEREPARASDPSGSGTREGSLQTEVSRCERTRPPGVGAPRLRGKPMPPGEARAARSVRAQCLW